MGSRTLGRVLLGVGVAGIVLSVIWWLVFYANVARTLGGPAHDLGPVVRCLFVNAGPCGFIAGVANAAGYLAYSPIALWLSIAVAVAGAVVSLSSNAALQGPVNSFQGVPYDRQKFDALVKYDEDIRAAAQRVRSLGDKWETELARAYLVLNSKEYLPSIVAKIEKDAAQEAEERARAPQVVEEGVYRNRKWRRYNTGFVEAETLGGRMQRFQSLEEFKRYIA